MATVKRSTTNVILKAFKDQLVRRGVLPDNAIKIIRRGRKRKVPYWTAEADILLHAGGFMVEQDSVTGAGRYDTRVRRRVGVTVRTRNDLDDAGDDETKLTDDYVGHYAYEDAVFEAIHMDPDAIEDAQDNWLAFEPSRLLSSTDPTEDPDDPSWTVSTLEFDVGYEQYFERLDP